MWILQIGVAGGFLSLKSPRVETVLVTEDENIVRKIVVRAVMKMGYTVLRAHGGKKAVMIRDRQADPGYGRGEGELCLTIRDTS